MNPMLVPAHRVKSAIAESLHNSSPAVREDFVERLRSRDAVAFDQWVQDESPGVYRLVSRLLGWQHDCDDVVQDVFVVAWGRIGRFRGDSDVRTWLHAIAINQCRRQRRRLLRRRARYRELDQKTVGQQPADASWMPDLQQIQMAIQRLSQRDREVIVLCGIQQTPINDVAIMLGLRKNTVEVRLHRARLRLKQILKVLKADQDRTTIGDRSATNDD